MLTILLSWLRDRVAIRALTFPKSEDCSLSSIDPMGASASEAETQAKTIATLLIHGSGSREELDTSIPFFELTDVESAMRHEGVIPEGRYVVFQDTSGRLLLQEQGSHRQQCASSNRLRRVSKTLRCEVVQSLGNAVQCSLFLLALFRKGRAKPLQRFGT